MSVVSYNPRSGEVVAETAETTTGEVRDIAARAALDHAGEPKEQATAL